MVPQTAQRLTRDDAMLLVVDFQKRLLPHIAQGEAVAAAAARMIRAAGALKLPVIATEQYAKGLGPTAPVIQEAFEPEAFRVIEKMTFSCAATEAFVAALSAVNRTRIIVVLGLDGGHARRFTSRS